MCFSEACLCPLLWDSGCVMPALTGCTLACPLECQRIANLRRFLASPPAGASGTGSWVWEPPYKDEERGLAARGRSQPLRYSISRDSGYLGNYLWPAFLPRGHACATCLHQLCVISVFMIHRRAINLRREIITSDRLTEVRVLQEAARGRLGRASHTRESPLARVTAWSAAQVTGRSKRVCDFLFQVRHFPDSLAIAPF